MEQTTELNNTGAIKRSELREMAKDMGISLEHLMKLLNMLP